MFFCLSFFLLFKIHCVHLHSWCWSSLIFVHFITSSIDAVASCFSAYDSKSGVYHIRWVVSCILFSFASSACHRCCHATRVIGSRLWSHNLFRLVVALKLLCMEPYIEKAFSEFFREKSELKITAQLRARKVSSPQQKLAWKNSCLCTMMNLLLLEKHGRRI